MSLRLKEKVNPVEQNIEETQLPEEIHEEHKDLVSRRTSSRIVWKSEDIMKVRKFFNILTTGINRH